MFLHLVVVSEAQWQCYDILVIVDLWLSRLTRDVDKWGPCHSYLLYGNYTFNLVVLHFILVFMYP